MTCSLLVCFLIHWGNGIAAQQQCFWVFWVWLDQRFCWLPLSWIEPEVPPYPIFNVRFLALPVALIGSLIWSLYFLTMLFHLMIHMWLQIDMPGDMKMMSMPKCQILNLMVLFWTGLRYFQYGFDLFLKFVAATWSDWWITLWACNSKTINLYTPLTCYGNYPGKSMITCCVTSLSPSLKSFPVMSLSN